MLCIACTACMRGPRAKRAGRLIITCVRRAETGTRKWIKDQNLRGVKQNAMQQTIHARCYTNNACVITVHVTSFMTRTDSIEIGNRQNSTPETFGSAYLEWGVAWHHPLARPTPPHILHVRESIPHSHLGVLREIFAQLCMQTLLH
jgi:hypothetical protein